MSWKIWTKVTFTLSWFEPNDVLTKLKVLFNLACLVGFTHHQPDIRSFNEDAAHNTQRPARRAFYLAPRGAHQCLSVAGAGLLCGGHFIPE
ncbi:hypothetical protein CRV24_010150 [Beauveria bassiana]|nr:hypothetical protein CRV24_010150 [Beauveria bassiana]